MCERVGMFDFLVWFISGVELTQVKEDNWDVSDFNPSEKEAAT